MARQLNDVLNLEREIEGYRDTLLSLKYEIQRIRSEYLGGGPTLSLTVVDQIDEEMETISLAIENALF